MALDKEAVARRVYNLPTELVSRIQKFQTSNSIASETEAVRRLLDVALQMRDGIAEILRMLESRFREEKDLRVLTRDIIVPHILVQDISMDDDEVRFKIKGNTWGRIESDGNISYGLGNEENYVSRWLPLPTPGEKEVRRENWKPGKIDSTEGDEDDRR